LPLSGPKLALSYTRYRAYDVMKFWDLFPTLFLRLIFVIKVLFASLESLIFVTKVLFASLERKGGRTLEGKKEWSSGRNRGERC